MGNSLSQLSNTYEECIKVQQNVIDQTRKKLKEATERYDIKEVHRVNTILKVLYEEKMELEMAAHEMMKYLQ